MGALTVLLVAPLLGRHPGRVPDVFEELAPRLAAEGHSVVAVSPMRNPWLRAVHMLAATARHRRVDVVVVHLYSGRSFTTASAVTALASSLGAPLVGLLSGGGLPALGEAQPDRARRVLGRFRRLVAPSPYLAEWAAGLGMSVEVVPNPVPLATSHRVRTASRPRLLWMRALHEVYAPELSVQVAARLAPRHPDLVLTIAGADKGGRRAVEARVREAGLEERVRLVGFAGPAAKRDLWSDHDIFLNTARVDNRPTSVVEAAGAGLVVVSTDAGGMPDLVRDGESGLLVPVDDPGAMAAAVERVISDPELSRHLSAAGRTLAEESDPRRVTLAWSRLLSGAVSGPDGSRAA